jgi:hypothetical protein
VQQSGGAQGEATSGDAQGGQMGDVERGQRAAPVVEVGVPGVGEAGADEQIVVDRRQQAGRVRCPGGVRAQPREEVPQLPGVVPQGAADGPQPRLRIGGHGVVLDGRHAPHGCLDDGRDGAVPVRVEPGGLDGGLGDGRDPVAAERRGDAVDGGAETRPVQGVVRAEFARDAHPGRDVGDAPGEAGQVAGQLDEAAADVDAVQRTLEERFQLILEREQGTGFRQGGTGRAVGQPLGLFQEAGAEEVPEVTAEVVRARQPALVAAQAVGVEAEQQVPGGIGALGEARVGEGALGEAQHGGAADGLVGVRSGDDESLAAAVADRQQPQGRARAGGADAAQPGVARMAGDEGGGPGAQLVDGRIAEEGRQGTPPS